MEPLAEEHKQAGPVTRAAAACFDSLNKTTADLRSKLAASIERRQVQAVLYEKVLAAKNADLDALRKAALLLVDRVKMVNRGEAKSEELVGLTIDLEDLVRKQTESKHEHYLERNHPGPAV